MITVEEVRSFLQTAGADFSEERILEAISLATERAKRLLNVETLPEKQEIKKALILLTIAELAVEINLYYKGKDNVAVLRTKDVVAEAERLLGLTPKGEVIRWI